MGVNFGSVLLIVIGIFLAKISFENFGDAQAKETHVANSSFTIDVDGR